MGFQYGTPLKWPYEDLPNNNFLWCGKDYPILGNEDLYARVGDKNNTEETPEGYFRTPDFAGLATVGVGTYTDKNGKQISVALGEIIGEYEHKLAIEELAKHQPKLTLQNYGSDNASAVAWASTDKAGKYKYGGDMIEPVGGDKPHNNTQPSIGVNYIIKAKQTIPIIAKLITENEEAGYETAYSSNATKNLLKNVEDKLPEMGSNANGSWIKYPDGTMIQWGNNRGVDDGARYVILPIPFVHTSYTVSANTDVFATPYVHLVQVHDRNLADFRVTVRYCSSDGGAWGRGSNPFTWLAIGRWKV